MEWICLLCVAGPTDHPQLEGCPGAYVNVVTTASDADACLTRIRGDVQALGLQVEEVLWCETLEARLARYTLEDSLLAQAQATQRDHQTRFDTFHTWERED